MTIHVVGGVYREYCVHPHWNEIYGSAGRAALAIANMGTDVVLHSYMDDLAHEDIQAKGVWFDNFAVRRTPVTTGVGFRYLHDMAVPQIYGIPATPEKPLLAVEDRIVRFGMLEGDAVVHATWAVYDPQNVDKAQPFGANGSTATHLALVLNSFEAAQLAGMPGAHPSKTAPALAKAQGAEVVIVKMGAEGAFVWTSAETSQVPAFRTSRVWKVGSGDCFVAHFANAWMNDGLSPKEAAERAARATAYFCETLGLPTKAELAAHSPELVVLSPGYLSGEKKQVYLAGPFFDLTQVWMVEQARSNLSSMGLRVFSPFHDIGIGSADDVVARDLEALEKSDVVFAITDGLDAGTIYEIGYARALGKPVVVYSERHQGESLKMMEGSGCILSTNYTTAVYTALWEAVTI